MLRRNSSSCVRSVKLRMCPWNSRTTVTNEAMRGEVVFGLVEAAVGVWGLREGERQEGVIGVEEEEVGGRGLRDGCNIIFEADDFFLFFSPCTIGSGGSTEARRSAAAGDVGEEVA